MIYIIYLGASVAVLFYLYVKWAHSYWLRKNVEYIKPVFFFGNVDEAIDSNPEIHRCEAYANFYNYFKKKGLKFGGVYLKLTPVFVIVDLELIKSVLQTDFSYFMNHDSFSNEEEDPLTGSLFQLRDTKWKNMRSKLTPTFTSGKMKMMFETLVNCTSNLENLLDEHVSTNDPVDIKDILSRFTTDIISSVAFGVETKSLQDPNSVFIKVAKYIFSPKRSIYEKTKRVFVELLPDRIIKIMKLSLRREKLTQFFLNWVKNMVEYRETNNIFRKDFLHLLIQLKNMNEVSDNKELTKDSKKNSYLSLNQMTAQCFVFFVAGFETSSTTMTSALMNLGFNQDIQDKTREEIVRVLKNHNNQISYDAIKEMEYLDRVVAETLRKNGPASIISRACNKDYKVPGSDLVIKKGTLIRISTYGLHRDPEYFPNPEKFDPDRFTPENRRKIPAFAYIPFGEGPRACIGLRFAMMQVKVGLCSILKNYKVSINEKTQLPIKIDPIDFIPSIEGRLWLNLEKV